MRPLLAILLFVFTFDLAAQTQRRYIVEYIVEPGPAAIRGDLESLRDEGRIHVRREFSRVLNGVAIELAEGTSIDEIARLPYVARVTPDAIVTAYAETSFPSNAGARMSTREDAGDGIVIAVIDTGIDRFHPALAGKVIGGHDFVNDDDDPMDDNRHGTHVAGIIAASSSTMSGVAPGASLLAYKVLDSHGSGHSSAVIAAIERAIADGADVINLSLGSGGHPGDPTSRAVDAATAAGVVVVVAAGNVGEHHSIGSPGVAATAITVGATDNAASLAEFSSRGPAGRSGAIKPDLVAPGVSILSTVPGGEFKRISGTSMAAPHVAGLAALLRAEHPEWTPARVKAALVSTALPLASEEVMAQGAGNVDMERAFASEIMVAPTQMNFGLDGIVAPRWTSTRTLSLRNDGAGTRTIRLRNEAALVIRITPTEVTLAPGETREVEVAIEVDHETLGKPATRSFSFGGRIVLEWDGGDARVPWAFVRAGRAIVTYPGVSPFVFWNTGDRYGSVAVEPGGVEALLEPGVYDLVAMTKLEGDVRIFVSEGQRVEGEVLFALDEAAAPHVVTLDSVDERGLPLSSSAVRARFELPSLSIVLPPFADRKLHTSTFSDKYALTAIESSFVPERNTVYVVQHARVRGISADVTLRNQPTEYRAQEVRLRFADAVPRSIVLMPRDWPRRPQEFGPIPETFTTTSMSETWTSTVMMTREHDGDSVGGLQISAFRAEDLNAGFAELITPMIRRDAIGFFAAWGFPRPPVAETLMPGEVLEIGTGALHGLARIAASQAGIGGTYEIRGEREESLRRIATSYRITNVNDVEVAKGDVISQALFASLPGAGTYRAELRSGASTMTMRFTTHNGSETTLPSLTSFATDSRALVFSAADFEGDAYRAVPDDLTKVFFRRRGANVWVQLTPVRIAEEDGTYDALVRWPYGKVYRVDLADALRVGRDLEIAIELTDTDGNSSTWVTPLVVPAARRRAIRP